MSSVRSVPNPGNMARTSFQDEKHEDSKKHEDSRNRVFVNVQEIFSTKNPPLKKR